MTNTPSGNTPDDPWGTPSTPSSSDPTSSEPYFGQAQPPQYGQQPPQYGQQPPAYGQNPPPYGQQPPAYGPPMGAPYGAYGYGAPQGPPPPNYLVLSIIGTLLCCLPAGVVSIYFSSKVNTAWMAGDVVGAEGYSRKARTWAIASFILGIVGALSYIGLAALGMTASSST